MFHTLMKVVSLGALIWTVAGCATTSPVSPGSPLDTAGGFTVDDIIDTGTARTLSRETLFSALADSRIVYVGETHTGKEDHRVQLEILKGMHRKNPSIILALEMFPRNAQPALDRYSAGITSEDELIAESRWATVWGYSFDLYRDILEFARRERLRIAGLNAPNEIVSKIAQSGFESLSHEERMEVARDFNLDDPANRERIRREYDQHIRGSIRDFESFYEAQSAWEETMAETLADMILALPPEAQVVVLLGKGHMTNRLGVPAMTFRRIAHTFTTIAPVPVNYPYSLFNPDIAEYIWVTDKAEMPHRGRLGILIRPHDSGSGLEVLGLTPEGPAATAGILQGDILVMINGTPVNSLEDLHRAMVHQKEGPHVFVIRRNGEERTMKVNVAR